MTNQHTNTALITGGTRGLGRALSFAFARLGWHVYATGRDPELLSSLRDDAANENLSIRPIRSDLSSANEVQTLAAFLERESNAIDLLLHNASMLGPRVALADYPSEDFSEVLRTNVSGPFWLTRALLPLMKRGASIQFVSSGVGVVGKAKWGAYSISKFGFEGMAQIFAEELKEREICVHIIDPGSMRTKMRAAAYPQEDPMKLLDPTQNTDPFVTLATQATIESSGQRFKAQAFTWPA